MHDSFDPYAAAFKRQFGISGNQAMELFHRTISMKQVENITSFVRTNMLEEDDVAVRIGNLIHHFDDLKRAHDAVLRAKDQIALLTPIRELSALHAQLSREDELARIERDQLHPWFTRQRLELSLEHRGELERTAARYREDGTALSAEIAGARHDLSAVEEDIRTNGGGRLAAIDVERGRLEEESRAQRARFDNYRVAATDLGLQLPEDRVVFDANRLRLEDVETGLRDQSADLQEQRTTLTVERSGYAEQLYNSGNLPLDLLYNLMLEATGRLQKCRMYEMTDNNTARSTIAYLIVRDQAHENGYAKALETLGVSWKTLLPIPKTNAEQFPEVKKLLDLGLQSKQYTFDLRNESEAGKIYQGLSPSNDGTQLDASEQAPVGVPSVIAPERFEEFAPGLDPELLQLIQATADMEMADIDNMFGPTGK